MGKSFGFDLHMESVRLWVIICKVINRIGFFIRFGLFLKGNPFFKE